MDYLPSVRTTGSGSDKPTMRPESSIQLTATVRNGLVDNILSGQPIMHRQPVTVKQIITASKPTPAPIFN
jgi:hypothetical protein